jgi:cystathionine gamma-synthase
MFVNAQSFAFSPERREQGLGPGDLTFKVADINKVRIYVVVYPMQKTPGILGLWQLYGTGISTRLAEDLLKHLDTLVEVPFDGGVNLETVPPPTWLPEVPAHAQLRERINWLLHRAPVAPDRAKTTGDDVYLYQTGMASIYRLHEAIMQVRNGPAVPLGSIFHHTFHIFTELQSGLKHFADLSAASKAYEELEAYLEDEAKQGRKISYVFLEFPSNPILVSADLPRLRALVSPNFHRPRRAEVPFLLIASRRTSTTSSWL